MARRKTLRTRIVAITATTFPSRAEDCDGEDGSKGSDTQRACFSRYRASGRYVAQRDPAAGRVTLVSLPGWHFFFGQQTCCLLPIEVAVKLRDELHVETRGRRLILAGR